MQVRVRVPAGIMRRVQALMAATSGRSSSGLVLMLKSHFQEACLPIQVNQACKLVMVKTLPHCCWRENQTHCMHTYKERQSRL